MIHEYIVDGIEHKNLVGDNVLHVVGVVFNPMRYHSRIKLFRKWYEEMKRTPNVKVYVVEVAFGDREFEVTDPCDPTHLQLRSDQILWFKESALSLGIRYLLPRDWKYLSWCDTDLHWHDHNWAKESLHQMQRYDLIQPWRDCLDLGPHGEVLTHFQSFCYVHRLGVPKQTHPGQPYKYAHSGFAWCCTRKFFEAVRGDLMSWCVVGSADHHMAWASIGAVHNSVHGKMSDGFKQKAKEWERLAMSVTHGQVGFVNTTMDAHFHGPKRRRYYRERWSIFIDHKFDPSVDLGYDEQGLVYIKGKHAMMNEITEYMNSRAEDSIDTY